MKRSVRVAVATGIGARIGSVTAEHQVLMGLVLSASIVVLDFFIVLACLPSIGLNLGASAAELQLVVAAYGVANGSMLIIGGRVGDLFGRRRVLLWGVTSFAVASAACGLSTSATALIVFRALQGAAGAFIQPQALGLLHVNFEASERQRVFGIYAATMGATGVLAQLVGGAFIQYLPLHIGWRACFLVAVPMSVAAAMLARTALEGDHDGRAKLDLAGAGLLGLGMAGLCAVLTLGRESGWPDWTLWTSIAAVSCLAAFWRWQVAGAPHAHARLLPAGLLLRNRFWSWLLVIFSFYAGVASLYFMITLHLRVVLAYSPIEVGLLFGWLAATFATASTSRKLKAMLGPYWAQAGCLLLALGHGVMWYGLAHAPTDHRVPWLLVSFCLQGVGLGCIMGALMGVALSKVTAAQASIGGGVMSSVQALGNAFGIAAMGFVYFGIQSETHHSVAGPVLYLWACLVVMLALLALADFNDRPAGP